MVPVVRLVRVRFDAETVLAKIAVCVSPLIVSAVVGVAFVPDIPDFMPVWKIISPDVSMPVESEPMTVALEPLSSPETADWKRRV